jgi:hypothetical protein
VHPYLEAVRGHKQTTGYIKINIGATVLTHLEHMLLRLGAPGTVDQKYPSSFGMWCWRMMDASCEK